MQQSIVAVITLAVIAVLLPALANTTNGERVAKGRQLYVKHCASCHGVNLEGQANWRQRKPDGRLPAPPHDATGHTWHHPTAQLLDMTKRGTAAIVGGDYKSDMPGFGAVLSDNQISAVLAYIKSTWPEHIRERHEAMDRRMKP